MCYGYLLCVGTVLVSLGQHQKNCFWLLSKKQNTTCWLFEINIFLVLHDRLNTKKIEWIPNLFPFHNKTKTFSVLKMINMFLWMSWMWGEYLLEQYQKIKRNDLYVIVYNCPKMPLRKHFVWEFRNFFKENCL